MEGYGGCFENCAEPAAGIRARRVKAVDKLQKVNLQEVICTLKAWNAGKGSL